MHHFPAHNSAVISLGGANFDIYKIPPVKIATKHNDHTLTNKICHRAPRAAQGTTSDHERDSLLNHLVLDPILFVGGPWRAIGDLVRGHVVTKKMRTGRFARFARPYGHAAA